jgi:ornithine--oxo-acid transaminase
MQSYIAIEDRYNARNYAPLDVVTARGEGAWVWDVEGKKYLDCVSAYSAVNQDHCDPRIVQAMVGQTQTLPLTSKAFRNDQLPFLAK